MSRAVFARTLLEVVWGGAERRNGAERVLCCAILYTRATGWSQPGGLRLATNGEYAPAAHFFGSGASYEVVGVLLCVAL